MLDIINYKYDFTDKEKSIADFNLDFLNRTIGMFGYKNLPESIPEDQTEGIFQINGYGIVTEYKDDLVTLWGSWAPPYDVYYRAENVLVNNPWAKIDRTYKIANDEEAVLIKNDPFARGLMPIFNRAGSMMTEAQITFLRALINFRAMFVFTGDEDADAKTAKAFMKDIEDGKGGTMVTGGYEKQIGAQPLLAQASNYITQAIEAQQYVIAKMFNEQIGLQSTFNMKRERQTANETQLDEDPLRPLIDAMLEERQKGWERVNKKYGTDVEVEFKGVWAKYNSNIAVDGDGLPINNELTEEVNDADSNVDTTETNEEIETQSTEEVGDENVAESTPETEAVESVKEVIEEVIKEASEELVDEVTEDETDSDLFTSDEEIKEEEDKDED